MTHYTRRTFIAGTALALTAGPGLALAGATQTRRLEAGKPVANRAAEPEAGEGAEEAPSDEAAAG